MSVRACRPLPALRLLLRGGGGHRVCQSAGVVTSPPGDAIAIPHRVQRSPTDLLKALAGTVVRDCSGPHYKYQDDPYLTPASTLAKRAYALSKESGRRAARWIRDQNESLFQHSPDDPVIESFAPKAQLIQEGEGVTEVGCDTLAQLVALGDVKGASAVFTTCRRKGEEVPDEVLQGLLEILCYYNAEVVVEGEWVEERWFRQASTTARKSWKDNGLAEEVFAALAHKGPAAYSALIRGMALYYQVDKAWQLYQECQAAGVALDTGTYNALIRVASFLRDAPDLRWNLVLELLKAMAQTGTPPDIGTLNGTLEALAQMAGWRHSKDISLQVLAEFQQQGIQPSLASYYHLLTIHCREKGPPSHILLDILDCIEGHSFTLQDAKDVFFFVTAMEVARTHLQSVEAARRVDSLLHHRENHLFIGDSYKESVYYRHYLALCCTCLPVDEMMHVYEVLVPHTYTPEPAIMQEVLQAVRVSGGLQHLPRLWCDVVVFDHTSRDGVVAAVVACLAQHIPSKEDAPLTQQLAVVARDVWTKVQAQDPSRRNRVTWTGQMLGDVLEAVVRCGDYDTALEVLEEASTSPHTILGPLPPQALTTLLTAAVAKGDVQTAVSVAQYGQEAGHHQEAPQMARLLQSMALTPQQRAKVGGDAFLTPHPPSTPPEP